MGTEIERKYLVDGEAWRADVRESRPMVQGYLESSSAAIRVRIEDGTGVLTIKARTPGLTRGEWEYPIPDTDADELIDQFCGARVIRKVRHYLLVGDHEWTIDEFAGRHAGLVIAEIELDGEDEPFEHPPWLGREVSHDRAYYNEPLATVSTE